MKDSSAYLKEIDSLRAFAVLLVIFYHADWSLFGGGYVGVDVFFVLSGFLITRLLKKEISQNKFTFLGFYERRIRRLLPSYLLVLITSWVIGFLLFNAEQFSELARTSLASLFVYSNWYFSAQSNYFDPSLELNPLLHTWSLSVEEQFYLFWPVVLLIIAKLGIGSRISFSYFLRVSLFVGIFAVSLVFSVWLINYKSDTNGFFNTFARIWELAAGALIALYFSEKSISLSSARLFRVTGLILIFLPAIMYTDEMSFPGLAAITPVLGTLLFLIATASPIGGIYQLLCWRPLRYLGSISYSLYLWHWPVFVFGRFMFPKQSLVEVVLELFLSLLLAILTTHLVENPIRYKRLFRRYSQLYWRTGLSTFAIAALCSLTLLFDGLPTRWNYERVDLSSVRYRLCESLDCGGCFLDKRHTIDNLLAKKACLTPEDGKPNILVIGDSFAAHLMPGIRHHFPEINFNQATASSCRAIVNFTKRNKDYGKWPCPFVNRLIFDSLLKADKYDGVLLISDWQSSSNGGDGPALKNTIKHIEKMTDIPVFVFGNSPVYKSTTDLSLRRHFVTKHKLFHPLEFREGLLAIDAYNHKHLSQNTFVSLLETFCPGGACPIITADNKMVHSGSHLTEWGAIEIIGAARPNIEKLFSRLN